MPTVIFRDVSDIVFSRLRNAWLGEEGTMEVIEIPLSKLETFSLQILKDMIPHKPLVKVTQTLLSCDMAKKLLKESKS